ncbi:arylamine N-acetyltransferase [Bacillus tianshenii]|nr:arylamine N-acetyltransferase [Bacillus tianshenii]
MRVIDYLQRIGMGSISEANYKNLHALQKSHMYSIPFENLDVLNGVPIIPNVEKIYEKVIKRKRGGFCYELNGLFHWLIVQLGYEASLVSATVQIDDDKWSPVGSHASIIVYLDQPYLIDVGFGDSFRQPLPLTGEEYTDVSGTYRVVKLEEESFELQKKDRNGWRTQFRFTTEGKALYEFEEMCHYNQTSPDSHFTRNRIVTIATNAGRITLSDDSLTITVREAKTKKSIQEAEVKGLLREYFAIIL